MSKASSHSRRPRHSRYTIVRKLGSGGSSSVYLARDLLDESREVALKVCHLEMTPEALLREFRILRELRHPGIARAFDFGRIPGGGSTYFTLEYVAGPDLERQSVALRRHSSADDPGPLLDVFLQVTAALGYLHRKGLLHLDLKPANIVFSGERVKLIDLGLFQNASLEHTRLPRGTAYFTAPEIFEGGPLDRRADLYSLGVTLYRSFTGRYPITGRSLNEVAENHRQMLPAVPRSLPEALSRIILKLLAKSPRHRFQSAEEVTHALGDCSRDGPRHPQARTFEGPDFAGRKRELDHFFTWFDDLRKGTGARVLAVEGKAGVGKSRFVAACSTEMLSAGAQVVPLNIFSGKNQDGLRLLVEKVSVLHRPTVRQRGRHRFLLTSLGLQADPASLREISELDLEQIRSRIFKEALEFFSEHASQTLVFVIEDFHRSDVQLRDFVGRLETSSPLPELSGPVGILLTRRTAVRASPAEEKGEGIRVLRLGRLSRQEILEALRQRRPSVSSREAMRLATLSGGNPGLLVQHLGRARSKASGVASASKAAELGVLLWREFCRLDESARSLGLALTLLGRPADERLVRAASGLSPAAFGGARLRLEEEGFLLGNRRGYYLDQNLLEEIAGRGLDADAVRRTHERIALRLRKKPGKLREAAHHLLRAGRIAEGLRTGERAAKELREAGKAEDAAELYAELLEYSNRPALRWRLLEEMGGLQEKSGQFDDAEKSLGAILDEADLPALDRLRVLRKLGGVQQRQGNNEAARRTFEEALDLLDAVDDIEEQLYLLNELAALYLFRGEFPRSTTFANRGLEMLGSPASRRLKKEARAYHALNCHSAAGHILLRQFEYERAAEAFLRGLEFAEEIGSLSNTALILNNLGVAYHQSNRLREALRVYARGAAIARKMGDGTALFSIQCNVATIRARMGELRAAKGLLREAQAMPHSNRSRRARLFLLHSHGLVERLALTDARRLWEESISLADNLPDPLFASYGRVNLLENEIQQGRWKAARNVLKGLEARQEGDARLTRAIAVRHGYLEALCGHREAATALMEQARAEAGSVAEGDLWERVYIASTLIELADLSEAEALLESTRKVFQRSKQAPGLLHCSVLLADLSLRRRDVNRARKRIQEARRALLLHDTPGGSRGADAWIPYLEARARLQEGRTLGRDVSDNLIEAASNLSFGLGAELGWLIDLVAAEGSHPQATRKAQASRRRFLKALAPPDRKSYSARDHRVRLGLAETGSARGKASVRVPGEPRQLREALRYETLLKLSYLKDPRQALAALLGATASARGAFFLEEEPGVAAAYRLGGRAKKSVERLRNAALRTGSGEAGAGFCAELRPPGGKRVGVLYVEDCASMKDADFSGFLETAGQIVGGTLAVSLGESRRLSGSSPPLRKDSTRTRTLSTSMLITSQSPPMRELLTLIERTRDSLLPIVVTGESGAGKDHLARWIHSRSSRGKGPFVAQDCSAIPPGLLEAEIFGYEAGAFSGATRRKAGYLLAAGGGTFYLDNIDSLSLEIQAKLLRTLEEGTVRPLGAHAPQKVNVRFMASSQRDLRSVCDQGEFRKDLYFRLSGICLSIPPLRERAEDIPLLIRSFQRQIRGGGPTFTRSALEVLRSYPWPGNVRELESVVRRLALTTDGEVDDKEAARVLRLEGAPPSFPRWVFEGRSYEQTLEEVKREYLLHLFDRFDGDLDRVARELGTTKRNVYLRFAQAGLKPIDLRTMRKPGRRG